MTDKILLPEILALICLIANYDLQLDERLIGLGLRRGRERWSRQYRTIFTSGKFFHVEFSCMPSPMCHFGRENEIQELTSFGRLDWVCPISFMEIRKHYNVIII